MQTAQHRFSEHEHTRRQSMIGPDLVPDYLTSVQDGGFYGWPYCYYGAHLDPRVMPQRPDLVAKAIVPD
jgi:glucose/arabinose dehydrogenase